MRSASWYRAMNYRPGGRDWMFRRPATLEFVLGLAHFGRQSGNPLSRWLYLHWPVEPRKPGTLG